MDNGTLNLSYTTIRNNKNAKTSETEESVSNEGRGGAIYTVETSHILLNNVEIRDNISNKYAGGIYAGQSTTLEINNSTISGNNAEDNGGAIYASESTSTEVKNTTISNNKAKSGGGIYGYTPCVIKVVENSTISNNKATTNGGGIYGYDLANITVNDSNISGNTANIGGGIYGRKGAKIEINRSDIGDDSIGGNAATNNGGGIHVEPSSVIQINESTIHNNESTLGAGIALSSNTQTEINNSTISNNTCRNSTNFSRSNGGGIYIGNYNTVKINHTEISGNIADSTSTTETLGYGGGIYITPYSVIEIVNQSTIINNTAKSYGGGIFDYGKSKTKIQNTIISGNKAEKQSGGGIFVSKDSIVEIFEENGENTEIKNNISGTSGGGISTSGIVVLHGGKINNNTAGTYGGGVRTITTGQLAMRGGEIKGNTGNSTVGGISIGGTFKIDTEGRLNSITQNTVEGQIKNIDPDNGYVIDSNPPVVDIKYSTTQKTDVGVTVTINADEELQEVAGWSLSLDKKTLTKIYRENAEATTITIHDLLGNSISCNINKIDNIDHTLQRAIQEIAWGYYMRGKNIQYNSANRTALYSPEEATSQNRNYVVCSAFVRNVYYELLKEPIETWTADAMKYARNNIEKSPEVILYANKEAGVIRDASSTSGYKEVEMEKGLDAILPYIQVRRCTYIY